MLVHDLSFLLKFLESKNNNISLFYGFSKTSHKIQILEKIKSLHTIFTKNEFFFTQIAFFFLFFQEKVIILNSLTPPQFYEPKQQCDVLLNHSEL